MDLMFRRRQLMAMQSETNLINIDNYLHFGLLARNGEIQTNEREFAFTIYGVAGKTLTINRASTNNSYFWWGAYPSPPANGVRPLSRDTFGNMGASTLEYRLSVPEGTVCLMIFTGNAIPAGLSAYIAK